MEFFFPSDEELVVQRALIHGPSVLDEVSGYPEHAQQGIYSKKQFDNPSDHENYLVAMQHADSAAASPENVERFRTVMESLGLSEVVPSVFAANLRTAVGLERRRRGLSQEEVGHRVGLYPSTVSAFLRGKRDTPYLRDKLSQLFERDRS